MSKWYCWSCLHTIDRGGPHNYRVTGGQIKHFCDKHREFKRGLCKCDCIIVEDTIDQHHAKEAVNPPHQTPDKRD